MHNESDPPKPIEDEYRKTFAQEAGISENELKSIMYQAGRRQTRHRKENVHQEAEPQSMTLHNIQTSKAQNEHSCTSKSGHKSSSHTQKVMRVQDKSHKKEHASIPKSVDQFYQSYRTFASKLFEQNSQQRSFIECNKENLFNLLINTIGHGGVVSVISQGKKNEVFMQFLQIFQKQSADEIFQLYKHFLLYFEYFILQNYTFKEYHNAVNLFEEATFIQENQLKEFLDKTPLDPKYFQYDIMVFKNGQNAIGIDSNSIHLDRVAEHYKDFDIDIRIQKALDYGFKPRTMRNEPYQMKIGDYRIYQKLCQEYSANNTKINPSFIERLGKVKDLDVNGTTFKERVKSDEIFFGVNFDPDDGLLFDYINQKVDGTFLGFKQEFDLLSYLDQQVPGCSFPQFYFKVKGVWTGGHQENINMCAVNINHGPDASEWYTMEYKYVEEFRSQLKKDFKMDLFGSQGLWYQKLNWFLEQGKYPIKKIIQKKGDIVISGPGTLHWVRSHGIALQSAWNQFPITYNMMQYAFHRQEQNERITFVRSNTIPLKMLTLKLLNHRPKQLTLQIKKLCLQKVEMWYDREEAMFIELFNDESYDFGEDSPRYEKLDDLQGFCTKCKQQILLYFVNGKKLQDILCLGCFQKQYKGRKKVKRLYMRTSVHDLQKLIYLSKQDKPFREIESFCSQYVGRVPVPCCKNNYKVEKQSIFVEKINTMNQELNNCDQEKIKQRLEKLRIKRMIPQNEQENDQEHQTLKNKQKIEIEVVKNDNFVEQKTIVESNKPIEKTTYRTYNGVKYIGNYSPSSGWWKFQIPEHLRIVSEENHCELLHLIYRQQCFIKIRARQGYRDLKKYHYRVYKQDPYRTQYYQKRHNHVEQLQEPNFSQDSDAQKDKVKKKVHKNQEQSQKDNKKVQNRKLSPIHDQIKNKVEISSKKRSNSRESSRSTKKEKRNRSHSPKSRSKSRQRKNKKSRQSSPKDSKREKKQADKKDHNQSPKSSKRQESSGRGSMSHKKERVERQHYDDRNLENREQTFDCRSDSRKDQREDQRKEQTHDVRNLRNNDFSQNNRYQREQRDSTHQAYKGRRQYSNRNYDSRSRYGHNDDQRNRNYQGNNHQRGNSNHRNDDNYQTDRYRDGNKDGYKRESSNNRYEDRNRNINRDSRTGRDQNHGYNNRRDNNNNGTNNYDQRQNRNNFTHQTIKEEKNQSNVDYDY